MMALVHASPTTLASYKTKYLGVLSSPRRFYTNIEGWRWAADNDAYSDWNPDRYRRMLDGIWGLPGCLFVTAPDVVGDADRTLELFEEWYDDLNAVLQPLALVAQDGLTTDRVPWRQIDALFIGGTTEFKMGDTARELVAEAQRHGKWVHMGRVNGHRRIRYAKAIGCDSFDGTSLSWFRDRWLLEYLSHAAAPTQLMMGGGR
jgi:hypothetical protein